MCESKTYLSFLYEKFDIEKNYKQAEIIPFINWTAELLRIKLYLAEIDKASSGFIPKQKKRR